MGPLRFLCPVTSNVINLNVETNEESIHSSSRREIRVAATTVLRSTYCHCGRRSSTNGGRDEQVR